MTDLNDFFYTDGIHDVLAQYVNALVSGNLRAELTNSETLAADKTLNDASFPIQNLTPSGADRSAKLPPEATGNHLFFFRNVSATYVLFVKDDSGSTTFATIAPGETALIVPIAGTTWAAINSSNSASMNYLINGGFDFAQRQTPATLTTIAQDKYGPDRWRSSRENADLQYQRVDGLSETGLTSQFFGTYKKITNAGKLMVYQIIEGANSVPLRGKSVTFSLKMKASSTKTIRMAVLELQTAGTIDTIPATLVSAWGANTVDPTFGSNIAVITGAQAKSVGTTMTAFSVTVTVPATSKNLIVAVWSDSQFSVNDTLSLAEAGLYFGTSFSWQKRPAYQELGLCQRYYEVIGASAGAICVRGYLAASGFFQNSVYYKVTKFAAPVVTKVGTWTVNNCNQPTVYASPAGVDACSLYSQITGAAGDSYFQTTNSTTYLTVESEL